MEVLSHVFLRAYESSSIYFNRLWNGCVIFLRQETNGVFVLVNWRINWNWNWQFHCTFFLFVQRANDKRIILVDIFSPELIIASLRLWRLAVADELLCKNFSFLMKLKSTYHITRQAIFGLYRIFLTNPANCCSCAKLKHWD